MCRKIKTDIHVGKGSGDMGTKGENTKTLIKKKAYVLFAQKGFKEVTMKDICEATGLSRGGLYGHYESTGQIFSEIVSSFLTGQNNELREKMESNISAVCILNELLEKYRMEMLDKGNSLSIAIYEYFSSKNLSDSENALSQQYLESFNSWESLLKYGISRGEFKNIDMHSVFDLIIFSYQGVRLYSRLMKIDDDIPKRIIEQIKSIILPENSEV